jgi:CubicO group peptidase (beta-lactamase class C family)
MIRLILSLIVFATVFATVARAQGTRVMTVPERIDCYLQTSMQTAPEPGLSAVVVQGDQVLLSAGYGFADRATGRPMTAQTPVAIGSTTKGMTALAVMQLVEQGRVDLDTPLVQYLPDFRMADERAQHITLRQLLSMSSGMPSSNGLDGDQDPDGLEHNIPRLASVALHRDPGTGFEYANDGLNLAGLLVQRLSGERYEDYVTDHLFAPLGMHRSTYDPVQGAAMGLAQGYGHHRGAPVPLNMPLARGYNPTGGALTTADDVGRYLRALLNGGTLDGARVLGPEPVKAMWTPQFRTGEKTAVGLGWMLEDVDGEPGWTWTGDVGTSSSVFLVLPERSLGVAVIANSDAPASLNQLAQALVAIALGGEPPVAPATVDVAHLPTAEPDRSTWDSYAGLYTRERDAVRVSRVGDHLVASIAGGDILAISEALGPNEGRDVDFVPTSATEFVLVGDSTLLDGTPASFGAGPDGNPVLLFGGVPRFSRQGGAQ